MANKSGYSRRSFLGVMGSSSVIGLGGPLLPRVAAWAAHPSPVIRFAYVASDADRKGAVHVFRVGPDGAWTLVQSVVTRAPSSLAVSHDGDTLFVANRVYRYQNRPAGSVESYRIDRQTGKLGIISRRSLALSAVGPGHIAVSPDARFLVVCATAGGAYNLLPILSGGALGNVAILCKETGASIHPEWQCSSRPQQVTFDGRGRLIASDLGADRLSIFEIRESGLIARQRLAVQAGSGPSAIQFHPGMSVLFAGGALDGTLTALVYDESYGSWTGKKAMVRAIPQSTEGRLHTIAVHPSGEFVVAAWSDAERHGVSTWRFDGGSFSFAPTQTIRSDGAIKALQFTRGGDQVIAANATCGAVSSFDFLQASGDLRGDAGLAFCERPGTILLTYL